MGASSSAFCGDTSSTRVGSTSTSSAGLAASAGRWEDQGVKLSFWPYPWPNESGGTLSVSGASGQILENETTSPRERPPGTGGNLSGTPSPINRASTSSPSLHGSEMIKALREWIMSAPGPPPVAPAPVPDPVAWDVFCETYGAPRPPAALMDHPVVLQAQEYIKSTLRNQAFADMDAELHGCIISETSLGDGPLMPFLHGRGRSRSVQTRSPTTNQTCSRRDRTGIGPDSGTGRLRERPQENGVFNVETDADADDGLARILQEQADEEAAFILEADEMVNSPQHDEILARRLQENLLGEARDSTDTEQEVLPWWETQNQTNYGQSYGRGSESSSGRRRSRPMPPRPPAIIDFPAFRPRRFVPRSVGRLTEQEVLQQVLELSADEPTSYAVPRACAGEVAAATSTVRYRPSSGEHAEECAICRDDFEEGAELRLLPCLHKFHTPCIDRWLAQSRACPVCKHDINS